MTEGSNQQLAGTLQARRVDPMTTPKVSMGLTLPDQWQSSTTDTLQTADSAHGQATDKMGTSMSTIRRTNAEHGGQRDTVHGQFLNKIRNTEDLVQNLSSRIHANKAALEHSDWSLHKLNTAIQSLAAPLELCKQRIAMRTRRPKRELVYDPFQEALLREEKDIRTTKHRLSEAANDTQKLIGELRQQKALLEADLRDKQHGLSIDKACSTKKGAENSLGKLDKSYSRKAAPLKAVLPEILGTPRETAYYDHTGTDGRGHERNRQKGTLRGVEAGMRMEQVAKDRWVNTGELLESCHRAVAAAHKSTQAEMGAKIEHTEVLKQELLKQAKATDKKIEDAQKVLGHTLDKLRYLDKPMEANSMRSTMRDARTVRENITDEVGESLHVQRTTLQGQQLQLQNRVAEIQDSIRQLQAARQGIMEDINDKDKALAIDRGCAAAKNVAHSHLSHGFSKVGQGQSHFADTASSKLRQTVLVA